MKTVLRLLLGFISFIIVVQLFNNCNIINSENELIAEADSAYKIFTEKNIRNSPNQIDSNLQELKNKLNPPQNFYQELIIELADAHTFWKKEQYFDAVEKFEEINKKLGQNNTTPYKVLKLNVLISLGDLIMFGVNDMSRALPYFLDANKLLQEVGTTFEKGNVHKYLGYIYFNQNNPSFAKKEFFKSLKYFHSLEDQAEYVVQEQIANIALSYYMDEKYDSALVYYDSCINFVEKHMNMFNDENAKELAVSVAEGNKARVYVRQGNYQLALKLLRKNYEKKISSNRYKENAQTDYYFITEIKVKTKNQNANLFLDTLFQLDKNLGNGLTRSKNLKLKAAYLADIDPKKSIEILNNYIVRKDSLYRFYTSNNLTNKLNESQYEQSKIKLALAEKEREYALKVTQISLLLVFITIILLIVIIYYFLKIRKQNKNLLMLNAKVNQQKNTIDEALSKLKKTNNQLLEINKLKTGILGIVAHDLKSPLDAIVSTIDLINEDDSISEKEMKELLQLIKLSSETSETIINELVIYAQLDTNSENKLDLQLQNINDVINTCIVLNKMKSRLKSIEVKFNTKVISLVYFDKERFLRVMNNLITNAIKFSYPKSKIIISATETNESVQIEVKDFGIGIPDSLKAHIFSPFSNARRNGTEGERSTGLGLSIVKKIIEAHRGEISLNSKENEGTSITITLKKQKV